MAKAIEELEKLEETFGLKLNKKNTVFIMSGKYEDLNEDIRGIKRLDKTKYLTLVWFYNHTSYCYDKVDFGQKSSLRLQ